jgi:pimeloyl-ACP methyl ester carboxylesterase
VDPLGIGVVFLPGGAASSTGFGRNQVGVALSRRLAAAGFHAVRFDYPGNGDSEGELDFQLANPLVAEVESVIEVMRSIGIQRYVLVGVCFGARTALAAAPRLDGIQGLVLSSMPVVDDPAQLRAADWRLTRYALENLTWAKLREFSNPERRRAFIQLVLRRMRVLMRRVVPALDTDTGKDKEASSAVLRALRHLVRYHTPMLFLYGAQDPLFRDFQEYCGGQLGTILASGGEAIEVSNDIEGNIHVFTEVPAQEGFLQAVEEWVCRRFGRAHLSDEPMP